MADYKGIKGFKVQSLAADPTLVEGQVWYNTAGSALKYLGIGAGAWASGGNVNNARSNFGSAGLATAAVIFLGESPYADKNRTEEYNGTAWTETNNALTARQQPSGVGTQTAALAIGGTTGPGDDPIGKLSEHYDGSCWTEGNDLNAYRYGMASAGTQTAAITVGGSTGPPGPGYQTTSETWNGTSWAEGNNLSSARGAFNGAGTTTAAIVTGGFPPPSGLALTETWNGTSWTEVADMNQPRAHFAASAAGTSTAFLTACGQSSTPTAKTELWDGTSWTEVADTAQARIAPEGAGTTALAICATGYTAPSPGGIVATEEWDSTPLSVKTVTVS